MKVAAVECGPGDSALWSRAAHGDHSAQIGSVTVAVPRSAGAGHIIQARTGTGAITIANS